ncbi:hypothetical protein L21SP5_02497 [Salinivirga cyanobacteriivorans]|uniref:Peptidase S74 domain-containing protein n=1 Tax=Salinivirga cyanobacteriivorans TaxID=1307839 RepID=A0A0S2I169_9BACT|nr:tail fiber domain-containing protein [Salinivirga cyanobacteriivorans]ALO16121.1 hypothetical protein L21SP5_02497 [Salinivirga cyanobacteriivorans]
MKVLILFLSIVLLAKFSLSQNITLSDDDNYEAHSSAMVDIYSKTKGLLVPRVTNTEMNSIATPANGLIVYNSSFNNYYYWDGADWKIVAVSEYFQSNGDTVFITGDGKRFGIGTRSPMGRLTVMGDSTATSDEPLFEVKNSQGEIIFAVYENEVQVNFKEDSSKALKGGFAVGGLTSGKSEPTEYLRITPDSVRIYIDDSSTKAQKGGFAVGGLTSGKANHNKYFLLNQDSTRIYHKTGLKAQKGGFAVGGLTGGKSIPENYLTVERDSTRIYVNENAKAQKGGFAVGGLTGGKGGAQFLSLTPENYFIGHESGLNTTGTYNAFIGYQSGYSNTSGNQNLFFGYQAGYHNTTGNNNTFLGNRSGYLNEEGFYNVYIGYNSGYVSGVDGIYKNYRNVFIGAHAGYEASGVSSGVYIGYDAGRYNVNGARNTFIGGESGKYNTLGYDNTFLGNKSGHKMIDGMGNTHLGSYAGYSDTAGFRNTFVGSSAARSLQEGYRNVFVGAWAGEDKTSGSYNVLLGFGAGKTSETSDNNIFIGTYAGENTTGNSNVFIGHNVGQNIDVSNTLLIGNSSTSQLIYGEFDNEIVALNANVGIGTNSPDSNAKLEVTGNVFASGGDFIAASTNGVINVGGGAMSSTANVISDGTVNNEYATGDEDLYIYDDLEVDGSTYKTGSGTWITQSDRRLKKDIRPYQDGLSKLLKINPVFFRYNELAKSRSDKEYVGIIAQEIKEIMPYAVDLTPVNKKEIEGTNGEISRTEWDGQTYYTFDPASLTFMLINAVKEQQKIIEKQQLKLRALENKSRDFDKLKNELDALKKAVEQLK